MPRTALITGASSGIGRAIAVKLHSLGYDLIVCARRRERIEALKAELGDEPRIHCLSFDVRDKEKVFESIKSLPYEFQQIDLLVNNAGNAHGLDPIQRGKVEDWEAMIDINVKGLLYVTKAILPGMVERKDGMIINIGSIAGKEVYPMGNVYSASKFAVDALNQGMRLDLHAEGIRVSSINPGLVETEFSQVRFKGDKEKAEKVYKGYKPLDPEDVAEILEFMVTRPKHVNLADILVLPTDQASSTIVNKKTE